MKSLPLNAAMLVTISMVLILTACVAAGGPAPTPATAPAVATRADPGSPTKAAQLQQTPTAPPPTPTQLSASTPVPPTARPAAPTPSQPASIPTPFVIVEQVFGSGAMVSVPAGDFIMGNDAVADEKPQQITYLDGFWIDKTEVTNTQYAQCVKAGDCSAPPVTSIRTHSAYYGNPVFDRYPVVYVTWFAADSFCRWDGKRLPTEAEWEKAARGTDGRVYPWGNTFDATRLNSYEGNAGDTTEVGKYPSGASPYGALDMAGNVSEWVADWYDANWYGSHDRPFPPRNPPGPASGNARGVRGGSFYEIAGAARSSLRSGHVASTSEYIIGFRCARSN